VTINLAEYVTEPLLKSQGRTSIRIWSKFYKSARTNTPKCARSQFLSATLLIVQMIMKKVKAIPSLFLLWIEPRFLGRRPSLCRMSCPGSHSSSNHVILHSLF